MIHTINGRTELGDEQPRMLISELGLFDPPFNFVTKEEAMIQYNHSSSFLASNSHCNSMQFGLVPVALEGAPFRGAPPHHAFQSQFAPVYNDFPPTMLPF